MKLLIIFIVLGSLSAFAGHPTCSSFSKGTIKAMKVTKTINSSNELNFNVKVDSNCRFLNTSKPVSVFWSMGKNKSKQGIPCEKPLLKEIRNYLGYNDYSDMISRIGEVVNSSTLIIRMPSLSGYPSKVGSKDELSDTVTIKLKKVGKRCTANSYIVVNSINQKVNRIHNIVKFFSLKKIELYQNTSIVHTLD